MLPEVAVKVNKQKMTTKTARYMRLFQWTLGIKLSLTAIY